MAKDRIEGVAESSGLSWSAPCAAVQCGTVPLVYGTVGVVHGTVRGSQLQAQRGATVQSSGSWERSPPLTPVLVGASPASLGFNLLPRRVKASLCVLCWLAGVAVCGVRGRGEGGG